MELIDFNNFEQFQIYMKQHVQEMPNWSTEQTRKFNESFNTLYDESPEFRQKYDNWIKRTQAQANKKRAVTIGGTPEQTAYSQAKLKLMEVKQALKKKKEESLQGPKEQTPQKQEKNNKKENSLSDIARTKTIKDKFIPEI